MTSKKKLWLFCALGIGVILALITTWNGFDTTVSNSISDQKQTKAQSAIPALKPTISGHMAAVRLLDIPIDINHVKFTDGKGETLSLKDFQDKLILLNLWATWCPPCRHEMPSLQELNIKRGGKTFEVLSVSIDLGRPDKPKAFFKENNLNDLGFYWDGKAKIFNDLKKLGLAFGMPSTILVSPDGKAIASLNGPAEWASKDAFQLIDTALDHFFK